MGTATAFEAFFRTEHPKLVALGIALTGNNETGRELAQESLLRAYRDWSKVGVYENPGGWVRRVLVNLAIDRNRRRLSEGRALARLAGRQAAVQQVDPVTDHWWHAVRTLPERQQAVVALHYLEDMSIVAVATTLGVAEGTVKTLLHRARLTLAGLLAEEDRS